MSRASATTHFAAVGNHEIAVLKVDGPGTCRECGRFENLLLDMEKRGFKTLVIDLTDCARLDSTFAGGLLRLATRTAQRAGTADPLRVVIAGASEQVKQLLDTLCLSSVFESVELPDPHSMECLDIDDRDLPLEEIAALSLDSHERLAELDESNKRRFALLIPVLRDELKRLRTKGPLPVPEAPAR
jgi:anti-anti-sigma regulatory factor